MSKRKRGTEKTGGKCFEKRSTIWLTFSAHLAQELSTRSPLRKSARLLERESHPSLSTTRLTVSRDHSTLTIAYLPEQYCLIQFSKNNIEKSTNDTSFESHLEKTFHDPNELDADHKRKQKKEPGPTDTESRKRPRKSERVAVLLNLDPKKRLKFSGDDNLSKKQRM